MGGRGPGAQIIALTFSTACDDLSPQARGADPKQRCLELKTELEQNYKACPPRCFWASTSGPTR